MCIYKFIFKKEESAKNKTQESDSLGEKQWAGMETACFSNGNALILMLGDGFTCIHFNVYLVTYLNITYILLCVLNIS